jgi:hypothetical protein
MEPAAVRTALVRIGFVEAAALALTEEQGLDSLDEIRILTDDDIANLCKLLRRPGGVVQGVLNAAGNPVPNPGIQVSARAETNLKLAAFFLRHKIRTGRTVAPADVTLASIRALRELREYEETYKPSEDVPTINDRDWPKTMETILEYLRSYLGDKKIPLAYVVRESEDVPVADPEGGYATLQDEMIARAPHFSLVASVRTADPAYLINREKVWDVIARITRSHDCWTYVKPAQRTRDGRKAYLALYAHYLGPNNVDNMASQAESKLNSTVYNGEQRRWNFERYVNVHKQQHSIMEGLVEHGYVGIDPRSKVRFLIEGIKTDKLDSVKTRIYSDATLRSDFDACVTLYQDFIKQMSSKSKGNPRDVNVSEVKVSGGKRKHADLANKRAKRGHKPGAKDSKTGKKEKGKGESNKAVNKTLKGLNRTVAQLAKQMGKADIDDASAASDSSTGTQPRTTAKHSAGTNRSNSSLTRQASPKKSK